MTLLKFTQNIKQELFDSIYLTHVQRYVLRNFIYNEILGGIHCERLSTRGIKYTYNKLM